MTTLAIYRENGQLLEESQDFEAIANKLHSAGVLFERWRADRELSDTAIQALASARLVNRGPTISQKESYK